MLRRWLIRSFILALCTFCVVAWVWSYPYREHLSYNGPTSQEWVFEIGGGSLFAGKNWGFMEPGGWLYYHTTRDPWAGEIDGLGTRALGFQYFSSPPPPAGMGAFVKIPFWFLTLFSICAAWIIWRKTRPLPAGFPIEPSPMARQTPEPARTPTLL